MTSFTPLSRFVQYTNETEEKFNDADEFLVHNYFNKTAVEGLLKSQEEVISMEYTTKSSFLMYKQELMNAFGGVEDNFVKTQRMIKDCEQTVRDLQMETTSVLAKKTDKIET